MPAPVGNHLQACDIAAMAVVIRAAIVLLIDCDIPDVIACVIGGLLRLLRWRMGYFFVRLAGHRKTSRATVDG